LQKQAIEARRAALEKAIQEAAAVREAAAAREAAAREAREAAAAASAAAAAKKQQERAALAAANGHRDKGSSKRPHEAPQAPVQKAPPLSPQETYNAKKKQLEGERQRRMHSIWSQCGTILKALKKTTSSWPFNAPVDPVKLNIPDYFNIIKKPMDLGTIEKKLAHNPAKNTHREYKSPIEFRDDVRQVWENCRIYNRPGQDVRKMGDKLSEAFERKWVAAAIEAKLKEEKIAQTRAEMELAELEAKLGISSGQPSEYVKKMRKLKEELREELENKPPSEQAATDGKMSFEQKRRMSLALGALPGDKLYRVLEIVSESSNLSGLDEQEEVELDIDSLDDETLWKLHRYVESITPAHSIPKTVSKNAGSKDGPSKAPAPEAKGGQREVSGSKAPSRPPQAETHAAAGQKAPAQGGGMGGAGGKGSDSDSSSSSSGGSSSSSGSDSDGGEQRGSTFNAGDGATGGTAHSSGEKARGAADGGVEMSALVSATRPAGPSQPSILKSHASSKKEVNLQNANAWASLTEGQMEEEGGQGDAGQAASAGEEPGAEAAGNKYGSGGGTKAGKDDLWSEFTAREQQARRREQERKDEERQLKEQKEQREEEERAKAERARARAEEEKESRRRQDEAAEAESRKAREEERAKELAKLSRMGQGAPDLSVTGDQDEMIKPSSGGGGGGLALLGLSMKDDEEDDDDDDEDEGGDSGNDEDMEDGEVN